MQHVKRRLHEILRVAGPDDRVSHMVDKALFALILLNILAVSLETVESFNVNFSLYFKWFEIISVSIFTVEYLVRIWTCTFEEKFKSPVFGRVRYILTPMALIDLVAILPFFLPFVLPMTPGVDFRFVRAVRMFRILRILKLGRYSVTIQKLGRVMKNKKEELVITLGVVGILLVFASSLMYYVENSTQPDVFSSIPAAMWWGIATLTTVGYGDVYPITSAGKLLGALIAVLGIGMVALPAGILGSAFMEEIEEKRDKEREDNKKNYCPHCGGKL